MVRHKLSRLGCCVSASTSPGSRPVALTLGPARRLATVRAGGSPGRCATPRWRARGPMGSTSLRLLPPTPP
eukprot:11502701-Alexandrium_andersonii.AAC.1